MKELLFSRTLKQGKKKFEKKVEQLKKQGKNEVDGKTACTLYSTFGFPLDLLKLMAEEEGMTVNEAELGFAFSFCLFLFCFCRFALSLF